MADIRLRVGGNGRLGLCTLAALVLGGCAMFLTGGKLVPYDMSQQAALHYRATSCTNATTQAPEAAPTETWHLLLANPAAPTLFERADTGSGTLIENHWVAADGDHFFYRLQTTGWEVVLPVNRAEPGQRLSYLDVGLTGEGATERPTSGLATRCVLSPYVLGPDGSFLPPSAVASPPAPPSPGFVVNPGGYVASASWHGNAWKAIRETGAEVSFLGFPEVPAGGPLCVTGTLGATPDAGTFAMIGMNLAEERGVTALRTVAPVGSGVVVHVTNPAGSPMRVQIHGPRGATDPEDRWCAPLTEFDRPVRLAFASFNTQCWTEGGRPYAGQPLQGVAVVVPGGSIQPLSYDFCVKLLSPDVPGAIPPDTASADPARSAGSRDADTIVAAERILAVYDADRQHAQAEAALLELVPSCQGLCSPEVVAGLWMRVGLVRGIGQKNQKKAIEAFKKGLEIYPLATPDVAALDAATLASYQKAKKELASAAVPTKP